MTASSRDCSPTPPREPAPNRNPHGEKRDTHRRRPRPGVPHVPGSVRPHQGPAGGALSGLWIGLFVSIAFNLISGRNQLSFLLTTPLLGAVCGLVWSQLGYSTATRRGTRDFASVNQIVATKYEVLVEHKHAATAHELLTGMPQKATV